MPFDLYNTPATFERVMEQILQKFLSKICLVYLDDVIIFGKNFLGNCPKFKKSRMREVNLKINPKKCTFFRREVKYLGYSISAQRFSQIIIKLLLLKSGHFRKIKNICGAFYCARIIVNL